MKKTSCVCRFTCAAVVGEQEAFLLECKRKHDIFAYEVFFFSTFIYSVKVDWDVTCFSAVLSFFFFSPLLFTHSHWDTFAHWAAIADLMPCSRTMPWDHQVSWSLFFRFYHSGLWSEKSTFICQTGFWSLQASAYPLKRRIISLHQFGAAPCFLM